MPSSLDLARSARRIEEMPTHDGSVLDVLAGAILRIFTRLNQIEADHARVISRMAALERSRPIAGTDAAPAPGAPTALNGADQKHRYGSYPPGGRPARQRST
jgi:hypothetical protein